MAEGGYGIVNVRGLYGVGGGQSTPWTSDDSGSDTKSQRTAVKEIWKLLGTKET